MECDLMPRQKRLSRLALIAVSVVVAICGCLHFAGQAFAQTATPNSAVPSTQTTVPTPISKAEADGLIFERQQIMKQLETDTTKLGQIAAGEIQADTLAALTKSIAQGAKDARDAFQSKVPGGRTKPEAWSNWPDFSQRLDNFSAKTADMAKLGANGDVAGVTSMMLEALPCKECHDLYRFPPKKKDGTP
jgi:cytochrome c556